MGSVWSGIISSVIVFVGIMLALVFAGMVLVKREVVTKETMIRVIISVAVFVVIFRGSDSVIGWRAFDVYVKAIEFLAAVIGAGCYWIGSNQR